MEPIITKKEKKTLMRIFVVKIREQFDYNRKSIRKFDNLLKGQGLGCYQPLLIIFGLFQKAREYKWKLVVLVHFGKTLDVIEREREEREIESSGLVAGAEEDRRCRWQKTQTIFRRTRQITWH